MPAEQTICRSETEEIRLGIALVVVTLMVVAWVDAVLP